MALRGGVCRQRRLGSGLPLVAVEGVRGPVRTGATTLRPGDSGCRAPLKCQLLYIAYHDLRGSSLWQRFSTSTTTSIRIFYRAEPAAAEADRQTNQHTGSVDLTLKYTQSGGIGGGLEPTAANPGLWDLVPASNVRKHTTTKTRYTPDAQDASKCISRAQTSKNRLQSPAIAAAILDCLGCRPEARKKESQLCHSESAKLAR